MASMKRKRYIDPATIPPKLLKLIESRSETTKEELPQVISDLIRFVKVTHEIITEPQAKISYKDEVIGGKIVKTKIKETSLAELKKIMVKQKSQPLNKVLREFNESVDKSEK